jgi:DNA-binding beta-propeller fold protein YncE
LAVLLTAIGDRAGSSGSDVGTGPALDPLAVGIGSPSAVAVGPKGEIYIASPERGRVFEVGADGKLRTVAGEADRLLPTGLAVDPAGNVYVSDPQAGYVYRFGDSNRALTIVAGSGSVQGDGGPAPAARLVRPTGLAWTRKGELLIADAGDHRVRRVDREGRIHTVAGDGEPGDPGDGGPAVRARLSRPEAVASDARGNIYIADRGNRRIRRVAAKTGTIGPWPTNGPADAAGLSVDGAGSLWIADPDNRRLLKLDRFGEAAGVWSDPAAVPSAVTWDPGRGVLFADATRHLVLRVTLGRAEVVAGNGAAASTGAPQPRR